MRVVKVLVIGLLCLYVIFPLLTPGFIPTHDGEYHLVRIWQFDKVLGSGILFPRWAPDMNSGYGLPLFNFQYPFPNYIGSFWHRIGFSLADSVKLTLATGYVGAVIGCFLWLSTIFPTVSALFGSLIFMFVPYWFVNLYVRGSVGEVLAMMWVMIALWAIEKQSRIILAVSVGLLIVTHNISAMLFVPFIALYMVVRKKVLILPFVLGLGLSAYFWLPALFEKQYMTGLNTVNFRDHFPELYQVLVPSWGTGFSGDTMGGNAMSPQIGAVPMVVFFLGMILRGRLLIWLVMFGAAVFMMLPVSQFVWDFVPMVSFIQFPWRFLSFIIVLSAFIGAHVSTKFPKVISLLLVFLAVVFTHTYIRPVTYAPRSDEYYLTKKNFTDGTSSLGNALSTTWTAWKQDRPAVSMEVVSDTTIQFNTLYYPGWTVMVDNKPIPIRNVSGLIQADIPKEARSIDLVFRETPLRLLADFISLASLIVLSYTTLQVYAHRHKHASAFNRT